jgi:hypothetical protein
MINLTNLPTNHPLEVYVPDGIARVVDPEGSNFDGELRTPLVYNIVAQGCCIVNNSTKKFTNSGGNVRFVSDQIFDRNPLMNSALYLALTIKMVKQKYQAKYECVSGANLARLKSIIMNATSVADIPLSKQAKINKLNRQPRLAISKETTYEEMNRITTSAIKMWSIGRVIDAKSQPMNTSVFDSFSPTVEAYIDIGEISLIALSQKYLRFQIKHDINISTKYPAFLLKAMLRGANKTDSASNFGPLRTMTINSGFDEDDDMNTTKLPSELSQTSLQRPSVFAMAPVQAIIDVHYQWISMFESTLPAMSKTQFAAVVDEYKQHVKDVATTQDVDGLKKAYEHTCARYWDSVHGAVQSAKVHDTRLKQSLQKTSKPNLCKKVMEDIQIALQKSIAHLDQSVKTSNDDLSTPPSEERMLQMSTFSSINTQTTQLITALDHLLVCKEDRFKNDYSQFCKTLKMKELPLEETYATMNESSTYGSSYSTTTQPPPLGSAGSTGSSSNSEDEGFLRVTTVSEKPRKRTPPKTKTSGAGGTNA